MDKNRIENAVREILYAIGENPDREGLIETPERVARMYEEIFSGIEDKPENYIKTFDENNTGDFITVTDIPFYSMCEHHLLPFFGKASVCYKPKNNKVIGLSKLARIVNVYAKKPQLQERLTSEIAEFLQNELDADGVCVVVEAEHLCMSMRGIKSMGAKTKTVKLTGCFKNNTELKSEIFDLLRG